MEFVESFSQIIHPCRATGAAGTYLWGGLCRIDVLDAPLTAALAFYSPKALRVHAMPLADSHARELMAHK